jgi:hypothetical protein
VSALYPAVLKYSTKTELLVVGLDYVTRVEKIDQFGQAIQRNFKPAEQQRRDEVRETELAKRKTKKRAQGASQDNEFIDNANVPAISGDFWPPSEIEPKLLPPRKRTKCKTKLR